MKISLDLIKPSPHPVRTTWDEEKMEELVQSIKEQGVIVPIKVRPADEMPYCNEHGYGCFEPWFDYTKDCSFSCTCEEMIAYREEHEQPFEIIYGHRRAEAARRAGLTEIETIIGEGEVRSDSDAYVQALIENICREDMKFLDECREVSKLKNMLSLSNKKVAKILGKSENWVAYRVALEADDPEIKNILKESSRAPTMIEDVVSRSRESGLDKDIRIAVIKKSEKEDLSLSQGRKLVKAIKAAPTPQAKKKLLEWEYSPTIHDPELISERAKTHGAHDPIYRDNKPSPQKTFDDSPEIKMLLDAMATAIQTFIDLMVQIKTVAEIGKLAPEGKQFMAHKLRSFRSKIDQLLDELENNNG